MEPAANLNQSAARLAKIRQAILKRFPKNKSPRHALLRQALADAEFYHGDQFRKSGEPAIVHPYRVALLVSEAGMGIEAVIIALLHDVIEDTDVTKEEVSAKYGEWLADAVDGLTKVAAGKQTSENTPVSIETYRKLLSSSVKDLRTLQVKIFDRLDNMRDLKFLERSRQRRIAMETMTVYVPMAQRLGQSETADEFATLCFRYLYPNRFNAVVKELKARIAQDGRKAKGIRQALAATLAEGAAEGVTVEPRYHKVSDYVLHKGPLVNSLVGFTVRVPTAEACYAAMGSLHMAYRVVPNSIQDFISNPKPNRHQGLASRIFIGGESVAIEVLSEQMALINRDGILADWQGSHEEISRYYQSYLELLDQFAGNEDLRMEDVLRFGQMDSLQIFTPIGEVLTFPQRATVLDLAFAIHTDLGVHCDGARMEGARVSRFAELKDGAMVEVVTSPTVLPDPSWLAQVRTTRAKLAIRRYLRGQRLSRAEEVGRKLFLGVLRRMGLDGESLPKSAPFLEALRAGGMTLSAFYQQIGTRKIQVRTFLAEHGLASSEVLAANVDPGPTGLLRYLKPGRPAPRAPDLEIPELGDAFIHLAPCCSPLMGDAVVGIQQEQGILVHRAECDSLANADPETQVSVGWEAVNATNAFRLNVRVKDQPGQIYRIGKIMRDLKVNIHDLRVNRGEEEGEADINIRVEPISLDTYQKIVTRLRGLKEVVAIT